MTQKAQDKVEKKVKRPTAQKRDLQNEKRRIQNKAFRSRVRTAIRNFRESVTGQDQKKKIACLNEVYSLVDKGVNNGMFKRNKAGRIKARLTAYMHSKKAA